MDAFLSRTGERVFINYTMQVMLVEELLTAATARGFGISVIWPVLKRPWSAHCHRWRRHR